MSVSVCVCAHSVQSSTVCVPQRISHLPHATWIEQGLTSHQTHYRSYWGIPHATHLHPKPILADICTLWASSSYFLKLQYRFPSSRAQGLTWAVWLAGYIWSHTHPRQYHRSRFHVEWRFWWPTTLPIRQLTSQSKSLSGHIVHNHDHAEVHCRTAN